MPLTYDADSLPTWRVKRLLISPADLIAFLMRLNGERRLEVKGLPPDARVVNVTTTNDHLIPRIALLIESESFPECHVGGAVQPFEITTTEYYDVVAPT